MIPVDLRLTNFMSYKHMDDALSFSSIHTAVLCGPNGHGKSSLLDAITWALWGRARGVDKRGSGTDDLIHHKEPHMQVEFAFELEGQRYRVIRSRSRKGKTGVSRLEFQIMDGDEPRPLTGETLNATQESINKVLRMDYETFVNSAFIMQGHADTFMVKSANERKEILSEILGLSIYDELEELAKEKRKALNDRLKDIDVRTSYIDQEIEHLPAYKQELKEAAAGLQELQKDIKAAEGAIVKLRGEKAVFDMKAAQLTELNGRYALAQADIALIEEQLKALELTALKARELTSKSDEIEAAYGELVSLRKKEEELSVTGQQHTALEKNLNAVKLAIEQARTSLESNLKHLAERKTSLEKELSQRSSVEAALLNNKVRLGEFDKYEAELNTMRENYSEVQKKKAGLDAKVQALEVKLAEEEKRRSLLKDDDSCPLCKKPLQAHERHAISTGVERDIASIRTQIDTGRSESARLERELESLTTAGKSLGEKIKGKDELKIAEGKLAEKLKAFAKASEEITLLTMQVNELNLKLMQSAFAHDEQSQLRKLSAGIEALGYFSSEHQKVKQRLRDLQKYEQLKANLENAQANILVAETTIATLSSQKEVKQNALADEKKKIEGLSSEISAMRDVTKDIATAEDALTTKKEVEATVLDRRSGAQTKIDACKKQAKKKGELVKERKEVAREAEINDKLAFIFSKKGIQALIIENTIPEIEEEANDLLHRLTAGQMSLRFVTQKDQRTGGVIETLDLIITDGELGDRKYELFSGGEAFRINFAVRIALSKLLARRSGARLETLVIDEGFGTQDEEGKERLIEAISAIQNDFKKIIIITHLEDLKELFPARIEVTKKRGAGSIATVV
ncbi:MAG: AAA family ATPase [Candidatus Aquicultor sp.]